MSKHRLPPIACRCSADEIAQIVEIAAASGDTRHRILHESVAAGLPLVAKRRGVRLRGLRSEQARQPT